jgi:hypothetical protein
MSKDILEKAYEAAAKQEEKEKKRLKAAESVGKLVGMTVAVSIDATAVWVAVRFLLGVTTFTWWSGLGVVILLFMVGNKFNR